MHVKSNHSRNMVSGLPTAITLLYLNIVQPNHNEQKPSLIFSSPKLFYTPNIFRLSNYLDI